jgi:hypothetical protein
VSFHSFLFFFLMWIQMWIRLFTADVDPDLTSQYDADPCGIRTPDLDMQVQMYDLDPRGHLITDPTGSGTSRKETEVQEKHVFQFTFMVLIPCSTSSKSAK